MAEGMTRPEAITAARKMLGEEEEDGHIMLPRAFIPLIRIALAVRQQWRMQGAGMGVSLPVAFDLVAVDVAARWLGITPGARLLNDLSVLEREALKAMRADR